ncbi:hypothetical protein cyc_04439 [Cyclospora cayetanensis]|uniref:Uncharacterized protein n=1 Tax=Cyclospora cayetanensis TaxID=88456 RepID=A0A1D3CR47_9EIME|nr:hypothetical protein cyc_04439 [Cyclospora cayetanensis]
MAGHNRQLNDHHFLLPTVVIPPCDPQLVRYEKLAILFVDLTVDGSHASNRAEERRTQGGQARVFRWALFISHRTPVMALNNRKA